MSTSPTTRPKQIGLALVGNPGAGKSTILNGVGGEVLFKSGVAIGGGLTTVLSQREKDGVLLFDTPGLADIERRKQAGQELDKLLARQLPLKIAFVVTLERGRVRPEDAMTIDLVLNAIKSVDTNGRFGIIINQMTDVIRDQLEKNPRVEAKMHKYLTGERSTAHWCYVAEDKKLSDASDQMLMTARLQRFLIALPETKPREASVANIDTSEMDAQMEKHCEVRYVRERCVVSLNGVFLMQGNLDNGVYLLEASSAVEGRAMTAQTKNKVSFSPYEVWHYRLGHAQSEGGEGTGVDGMLGSGSGRAADNTTETDLGGQGQVTDGEYYGSSNGTYVDGTAGTEDYSDEYYGYDGGYTDEGYFDYGSTPDHSN